VNRNGRETLLISDAGNGRIVEVSPNGEFLRAIEVSGLERGVASTWDRVWACGVAYSAACDVIAVTLSLGNAVVLLEYETGESKPDMIIGCCGQFNNPMGVAFTADGRSFLVADCYNERVSKFDSATGAFIAHVATMAPNGTSLPLDVLQCDNGGIVVVNECSGGGSCVVCVREDGVTVDAIDIPSDTGSVSISYLRSRNALFVKTFEGNVFVLGDAWMASTRCAWISALTH
jgi:DNA-binding beta-propeller fold protein YncE